MSTKAADLLANKRDILSKVHFGKQVAEDESEELHDYFVKTDQWNSILSGEVDIVYGAKGSGKSAIYSLLLRHQAQLHERGISAIPAENPQGAPAFEDLVVDPPASENEFRQLWKLYFVCLAGSHLRATGISNPPAQELTQKLEEAELLPAEHSLKRILRSVHHHIRHLGQIESISAGEIAIDPITRLPKGVLGRISLREPSPSLRQRGMETPDDLIKKADDALEKAGQKVWILLDRLDVVFPESSELEARALRALFRVYRDFAGLRNISLKLFLRTDIWKRITAEGFREASHISRHTTIDWHRFNLVNLIVRRLIHNKVIVDCYGVDVSEVLSDSKKQLELLARVLPPRMDSQPSQPVDWMISRLRDGSGQVAPRELIHFLTAARNIQIARLEVGVTELAGEALFHHLCFNLALREVSKVRFDQTLCAEYPMWKNRMIQLRGVGHQQTLGELSRIWHEPKEKALSIAENLVEIGFFEPPDKKDDPVFVIPHLYRYVLNVR